MSRRESRFRRYSDGMEERMTVLSSLMVNTVISLKPGMIMEIAENLKAESST